MTHSRHSGRAGSALGAATANSGQASRALCRAAMGAGMGYLLLASAL
ncbi:hypothetical protein ABJI51_00270 [Amycolatopsis sp. NEAU-NG30]|uniref:Uncharacterized protein n=1 Tax=Amycolatopsis melonis TaxID=3156488 RepID=A0ABV0L811_9PSEU